MAVSTSSVAKPTSNIHHLTSVEIAQRHKDGQCFHCDNFFTNEHKLVCKQLFSIEVVDDEDTRETPADAADPTISIHALTGISPCSNRTMQLFVLINWAQLTTLLDSRSTHNFLDLEASACAGIHFGGRSSLHIAVANGDRIHNLGCYRNMALSITDEQF
jgi:hypothetical protein